jgi:hypothetical protein
MATTPTDGGETLNEVKDLQAAERCHQGAGVTLGSVTESDRLPGLIASGALFVVNHSGGKDSQAMMIRLLEVPAPAEEEAARS